jgi:hypothetical protein
MNIFEPHSLLLFILFFMPGFVSIKVHDLLVPGDARNATAYIVDAVACGTINFIFVMPIAWLFLHYQIESFLALLLAGILVLLITPLLIAWLYVKLLSSRFMRQHVTGLVKQPWDVVFNRKKGHWVLVHLKDDKKIFGLYSNHSLASHYPQERQIFLEKVASINDAGEITGNPLSKGVIIMGSDIKTVEFFEGFPND